MDVRARSRTANTLGLITVLYLLFLWVVVLNPFAWDLRFPGGLKSGFITMLLAIVASLIAGIWGKRAWLIVTAAATSTFVYILFFYKMPMIY